MKNTNTGDFPGSPVVPCSIPGGGTKILRAAQLGLKKKERKKEKYVH